MNALLAGTGLKIDSNPELGAGAGLCICHWFVERTRAFRASACVGRRRGRHGRVRWAQAHALGASREAQARV